MLPARPRVLLFDLGGVLIDNPGFARLNELLPQPLPWLELKERWLRAEAGRRFESGRITPDDFAREAVAEFGIVMAPEVFIEEFAGWPRPVGPEQIELITRLKRRFRVACLSNTNVLHWERFADFVALFEVALASHLTGKLKPDAEAFEHAVAELGVLAEEIAFFDDSVSNIEAARLAGMRAYQVEGLSELKAVLSEQGFLEPS